jgi:hypothetical protein
MTSPVVFRRRAQQALAAGDGWYETLAIGSFGRQ